jgi:hypothetical protein
MFEEVEQDFWLLSRFAKVDGTGLFGTSFSKCSYRQICRFAFLFS